MLRKSLAMFALIAVCLVQAGYGQEPAKEGGPEGLHRLRLHSGFITPEKNTSTRAAARKAGHMLIQFEAQAGQEDIGRLQRAGIEINGWVPNNAVAAHVPEGVNLNSLENVRWAGPIEAENKLAPTLNPEIPQAHLLVDVFNDTAPEQAAKLIEEAGFQVLPNPYLNRHTLLVSASNPSISTLAEMDIVSFIYPAPRAIIAGEPVYQCAGGLTQFGHVMSFVPNGNGWDGILPNPIKLNYHFENGTPDVSGEEAEVVAALHTWSNYAQITWQPINTPNLNLALDIRWGADNHGDNFPFDGPGSVLAHGFFPNDVNSEPIAGDLHFDEDETWRIGSDDPANSEFDLYTIALHEAGHCLGLTHSLDTTAVMFAFYSAAVADLRQDDIDGIRFLYAANEIPRTSPPVFDPPPGTYEAPIEVRLDYGQGSNSGNTQIRYTLNGDEPTPHSFDFIPGAGDYVFQRFTNTIKARAFGQGKTPSEVVEATYTLFQAAPTVDKPVISPNGGSFNSPVTVSLSTTTEAATIVYSTDGSEPTGFSNTYTGPFVVSTSSIVKAKGIKVGHHQSETSSAKFNIVMQLPEPVIYPAGGHFLGPVTVYMGSTVSAADIRYTLDGSTPTETSRQYTDPVKIDRNTTVTARAFLAGAGPSPVVAKTFVIAKEVARPGIEPDGGQFTTSARVSLATSTPGAAIRYTTNGSNPTTYSALYSEPFTIGIGTHTVKARAFLEGLDPSPIAAADFDVFDANANKVKTPTISPFSGQQFVNNFVMRMDCRTEGAVIRYTVAAGQLPNNPTESGAGSFTYTQPFTFGQPGNTYFFKVRAFKAGMLPSDQIQSGGLAVNTAAGQVDTIAIVPRGGEFNNPVRVTLSSATPFAQIAYTDDGTVPNTVVPIRPPTRTYNNPFTLFKPSTITAKGFRTLFADSGPTSAQFTFKCATPEILPESGNYIDSVTVELKTATTGGNTRIFYTFDGSDPTEEALEYQAPFVLGHGNHSIRARVFRFNFENSETASAEFVVLPSSQAPVITSQPVDQTARPGDDVTFEVQATGLPLPDYQWLRNGVFLANETDSLLLINNVQLGDSGSYSVIVSNTAGTAASETAILTVGSLVDAIDSPGQSVPTEFALQQNYPNPFNPTTRIRFELPQSAHVRLEVFNLIGQKIRRLLDDRKEAGFHEVRWNGTNEAGQLVTSGVYLYRISMNGLVSSRKMIYLR